ncbi:MAG: hypothetical protein LBB34_02720 [Holosporales bacterium]|jgi:thymidine kinase|nr:hypothetical protein [Holosporales bacterium]
MNILKKIIFLVATLILGIYSVFASGPIPKECTSDIGEKLSLEASLSSLSVPPPGTGAAASETWGAQIAAIGSQSTRRLRWLVPWCQQEFRFSVEQTERLYEEVQEALAPLRRGDCFEIFFGNFGLTLRLVGNTIHGNVVWPVPEPDRPRSLPLTFFSGNDYESAAALLLGGYARQSADVFASEVAKFIPSFEIYPQVLVPSDVANLESRVSDTNEVLQNVFLLLASMFAGKSSLLAALAKKAKFLGRQVLILTSKLNKECGNGWINSRSGLLVEAGNFEEEATILWVLKFLQRNHGGMIIVDEAQFLPLKLVYALLAFARDYPDARFYFGGLDFTFTRQWWASTFVIFRHSGAVFSIRADCSGCGKKNATLTLRSDRVFEGEALCPDAQFYPICPLCYEASCGNKRWRQLASQKNGFELVRLGLRRLYSPDGSFVLPSSPTPAFESVDQDDELSVFPVVHSSASLEDRFFRRPAGVSTSSVVRFVVPSVQRDTLFQLLANLLGDTPPDGSPTPALTWQREWADESNDQDGELSGFLFAHSGAALQDRLFRRPAAVLTQSVVDSRFAFPDSSFVLSSSPTPALTWQREWADESNDQDGELSVFPVVHSSASLQDRLFRRPAAVLTQSVVDSRFAFPDGSFVLPSSRLATVATFVARNRSALISPLMPPLMPPVTIDVLFRFLARLLGVTSPDDSPPLTLTWQGEWADESNDQDGELSVFPVVHSGASLQNRLFQRLPDGQPERPHTPPKQPEGWLAAHLGL